MKYLTAIVTLALPVLLSGQGMPVSTIAGGLAGASEHVATPAAVRPKETILLVTLEDGSVVMQTISSNADICFKYNTDSLTTCLTRGEPVVDPSTNAIIGFEMIEEQIDLVAKQD